MDSTKIVKSTIFQVRNAPYDQICMPKSQGHWSFFGFNSIQVSEMSDKISLKMGVKFAASLNMW